MGMEGFAQDFILQEVGFLVTFLLHSEQRGIAGVLVRYCDWRELLRSLYGDGACGPSPEPPTEAIIPKSQPAEDLAPPLAPIPPSSSADSAVEGEAKKGPSAVAATTTGSLPGSTEPPSPKTVGDCLVETAGLVPEGKPSQKKGRGREQEKAAELSKEEEWDQWGSQVLKLGDLFSVPKKSETGEPRMFVMLLG